jgi:hypothetical protein
MKRPMDLITMALVVLFTLSGTSKISAQNSSANISGTWQATWETGIGTMNCTYTFIVTGDVLTGKVITELSGQKEESEITEGKVTGDVVTFTNLYQGNVKMVYTGKISGDEIKFSRDAGGFATEEAVVKRVSGTN